MDERSGHILIVEDELIVAHSIQMRLELHGYQVLSIAKSGEEALEALDSATPDLILMDIRLSGEIDGIDAAERIRRDHQIPIIFLTAYSDDETLARAKITEPFGYIIKPFETRELVNNIEIALYRQKMNAALHTSEARFRGLFESAVIGLALVDHDGALITANAAMHELLGRGPDDDLADCDQMKHLIRLMRSGAASESGVGGRVERQITCPDGTARLLQISAAEIPKAPKSPPYTALFVEDVTDLRQYERELEERQRALRALFFNEESIREQERTRLSRDIHDVLGQMLTAHKMDLHWIKSHRPDDELAASVDEMLKHTDEMIAFVKRVCSELRDNVLDDFGFEIAVDEHVKQFRERSQIDVEFHNECADLELPRELAISLLRIIQEALTNVARHAGASAVTVRCALEETTMVWTISDDGVGFDASAGSAATSLGLVGMNERAAAWGGSVEIESAPGDGTTVFVRLPVDELDRDGSGVSAV